MLSSGLGAIVFGGYGVCFAPVILVAAVHFGRDGLQKLLGHRPQ